MNSIYKSKRYSPLKKKCLSCLKIFIPHHRLGDRQVTCGQADCKRLHRAHYRSQYRKKNPLEEIEYQTTVKSNRSPEYWRRYRMSRPEYRERENIAAKKRKRKHKKGFAMST